jgi:hypothetical protein
MLQSATGPSTPPSGYSTLWAKTDDNFYVTQDTGAVVALQGSSGTSGVNGAQGPTGADGAGGATGYFGSFYSTLDQSVATINTPTKITLNSTSVSNLISQSGGTITLTKRGYYRLVINALASNLDGSAQTVTFWLKYNGSDFPYSTHVVDVAARKSAGVPKEQLISFEFLGQALNDGDTVEIYWQSTSTLLTLQARTGSGVPDSASIWANVSQIAYNGNDGTSGTSGITPLGLSAKNYKITSSNFTQTTPSSGIWYYDFVFTQPFASTNYNVDLQYRELTSGSGSGEAWVTLTRAAIFWDVLNKTASGFRLQVEWGSGFTTDVGEIYVQTIATGETAVSGTSGTSGSSGTSGVNGATGPAGAAGEAGPTGDSGTSGTSGTSGISTQVTSTTWGGGLSLNLINPPSTGSFNKAGFGSVPDVGVIYRIERQSVPDEYVIARITGVTATFVNVDFLQRVGTGTDTLWNVYISGVNGTSGTSGITPAVSPGLVAGSGTDSMESDASLTTLPANASNQCSIALGDNALSCGIESVGIGSSVQAQSDSSVSIGRGSIAVSCAVGLGHSTFAGGVSSVGIGTFAFAGGACSVVIGEFGNTNANQGIAIGANANSSATNSPIVIGNTACVSGDYATAIGNQATAVGGGSIMIGNTAQEGAGSARNIALGTCVAIGTSKFDNIVMSTRALGISVNVNNSILMNTGGNNGLGNGSYNVVLASDANNFSNGSNSVSIGGNNQNQGGNYHVQIGYQNQNQGGQQTVLIGRQNTTNNGSANCAVHLGFQNCYSQPSTYSLGTANTIGATGSVAIGVSNTTSHDDAVVLGNTVSSVAASHTHVDGLYVKTTPTYADNAAAKTGGLVDGQVYRTATGQLQIVYT